MAKSKQDKEWRTLLANAENALDQKEIEPPQSGKATEMRRMSGDEIWEEWKKANRPLNEKQ